MLSKKRSWWRLALVGLATWALSTGVALADDRADARRHFQAGLNFIAEGDYVAGIRELQIAHEIIPHPAVLFNIGRAFMDWGRPAQAIPYLESYLASSPDDREEAAALLADARLAVAQAEAADGGDVAAEPNADIPLNTETLLGLRDDLARALEAIDKATESEAGDDAINAGSDATGGGEDPYAQVVVTSSRHSQSPLEAASTLTVITAEDIRQAGARTLPDVLRRVPGLEVMAVTPGDYNIGIRGFNSTLANKVLVLVDGRTVYMDFIGATLWPMLSISVSDIDRIEVIRGPGAALYGANAFSGVINIITKRPGARGDEPKISLRAGIPDWADGDVHLTGRGELLSYRASVGFEQVERWSVEIDPNQDDYVILADEPDRASDIYRADLRLERRFGRDALVGLSAGMAQGQVEFTAIGALRDYLLDGSYGYLRGDLVLPGGTSLRAFWNHLDAKASPWSVPVGGLTLEATPTSEVVDVELEHSRVFELGIPHRVQAGLGYRYKTVEWEYLPVTPKEHHASVYVQDEMRLTEDVIAVASLRMDRHPVLVQRSGDDIGFFDRVPTSPRLALVWRVSETQSLRATAGTAFRNPTFLESYLDLAIPTTNKGVVVRSLGNLQLGPERMASAELGYLNIPKDERFEIQGSVFFNRVTELIALGPVTPPDDILATYDEAGGYWYAGSTGHINEEGAYSAIGGEAGIRIYPATGLDVWANYSYTHLWTGPALKAQLVESTSPHKINAGLQHRGGNGMEAGVDLHFVDEQTWKLRSFGADGLVVLTDARLPVYALLNVRLGYATPVDRLEFSVEATNLLSLLRPETSSAGGATITPAGRHREYPLGQAIPVGVSARGTVRF